MVKERKGGLVAYILLDESGSMDHRRQGVIDGFNQLIQELSYVTMPPSIICAKFDDRVKVIREAAPVYEVPPLTEEDYWPGGGTVLPGSIMKALGTLEKAPYEAKALVVFSDGEDGTDPYAAAQMVKAKRDQGWMVIFIGTDLDALKVGKSLGVDPALCLQFGGKKTKAAMEAAAAAILRFNNTRDTKEAAFSEEERKKVR